MSTIPTWPISGSQEVTAPIGGLESHCVGQWQNIKVTSVSETKDFPVNVRTALVGLVVPTIFTKVQLERTMGRVDAISEGTRFAYMPDVIQALTAAGKYNEAAELRRAQPNRFSLYGFEQTVYELAG